MEKLVFDFPLNEQQKKQKEELVLRLKKEPLILRWLQENHLSLDFIDEHAMKLNEWLKLLEPCIGCKGLKECRQPSKGLLYQLSYDGFLDLQRISCKFLKKYDQEHEHLKYYMLEPISDKLAMVGINRIDFSKENKDYLALTTFIMKTLVDGKKGIYLYGAPGVGKTYLGACITNYFARLNRKVAFVNVSDLISKMKMNLNDAEANQRMMKVLKKVDVLLMDDIGGESVSAWSRDEILMPILNERMENHRLTFFTSNYNLKELEEHLALDSRGNIDVIKANRLIVRIKALTFEKNVKGRDRRV